VEGGSNKPVVCVNMFMVAVCTSTWNSTERVYGTRKGSKKSVPAQPVS
jgi:hypothetical protein